MSDRRLTQRRRVSAWLPALLLLLSCSLLFAGLPAQAHEGHDHGPPAPSLPATVKPRIAVHSDLYELVAIGRGTALSIFLDRYATNEPVTDAIISVMVGADTVSARPLDDGTYRADLPGLAKVGRHELIFSITHPLGSDLLPGELTTPEPSAAASSSAGARSASRGPLESAGWLALVLSLALGLAVGGLMRWRVALALSVALGAIVLMAKAVSAHDGHDLSPAPSSESLSGDIPRRLPDGSVFLPKPSQRLLSVRSQIAVATQVPRAVRLVGRIIGDPNRSGLVQSINGGRVSAPDSGLPTLGQSVRKGQILATVTPALPLADQSTLAERQRELEGALSLARQRVGRLNRLGSVSSPRAQIEDTEQEIASLEQRLASLNQARIRPETLEAPIDGIVSASRAVSGQVVQAQDILFHIVDPGSLWVEALLFDPLDPSGIEEASATMPDGKVVPLAYRGRGRALQSQAALLHLAMTEPPRSALIGLPVTVFARGGSRIPGILLPRDAVVRGPGGDSIVWHHVDPERFVPRPVRVEPFDGAQVVITAGIGARDRIVVHAAELLSQVR